MATQEQHEPRKEDHDDPYAGKAGGKRYLIRQKMISIGNDFWIENEQGEKVYKVDGKIRLQKTFYIEDAHGKRLAQLKKRIVTVKETMEITRPDGEQLAVVKKDIFTPLKEHFVVNLKNGPDLDIHGNILDHEYKVSSGDEIVAEVSKKFFHIRDSYSVSIAPGQDEVIILALVVCIDEMTHEGN